MDPKCIDGIIEILEGGKNFNDKCNEMARKKIEEGRQGMAGVWEYVKSIDMSYEEKLFLRFQL